MDHKADWRACQHTVDPRYASFVKSKFPDLFHIVNFDKDRILEIVEIIDKCDLNNVLVIETAYGGKASTSGQFLPDLRLKGLYSKEESTDLTKFWDKLYKIEKKRI